MARSRRSILKAGLAVFGGTLVVAGGGVVLRGVQRGAFSDPEGPAYEAWDDWRGAPEQGAMRLVQSAILAANAHNTQPWIFQVRDDLIAIYADRARHLGAFDPYRREMTISVGCALQNMFLTAGPAGRALRVRLEPGGLAKSPPEDLHLLAVLGLSEAEPQDNPLASAIPARRTNRGVYRRGLGVPSPLLEEMRAIAESAGLKLFLFTEGPGRRFFDSIMLEATDYIGDDPEMMEESHRWFRATPQEVERSRDGPSLDSVGLSAFRKAAARILPPLSAAQAHDYWRAQTEEVHLASAPLVGMLCVRALYDQLEALSAGRIWQHLHLLAVSNGFAMQPMNQPAEVVDRQNQLGQAPEMARRLAELVPEAGWKPTFLFRMGVPEKVFPPAARLPLARVVAK